MKRFSGMFRTKLPAVLALLLTGGWQPLHADDIDIFKNNIDTPSASQIPNVLLLVDNGANWSSNYAVPGTANKKQAVSDALASVAVNSDLAGKLRMGLMIFTSDSNGAKLLASVEEMTAARRQVMRCLVYASAAGIDTSRPVEPIVTGSGSRARYSCPTGSTFSDGTRDNKRSYEKCYTLTQTCAKSNAPANKPDDAYVLEKTNNSTLALGMNEAYLYFRGATAYRGKADGTMKASWENDPFSIYALNNNTNYGNKSQAKLGVDPKAFKLEGSTVSNTYKSPAHANSCANNFVIVIGTVNGTLQPAEDTEARAQLRAHLGSDPAVIPLSPSGNQSNYADEYARFMSSTDVDPEMEGQQSIITYVIDVFDPATLDQNPSQAARALYKSIAAQGKGRYFTASNADEVAAALTEILNEVQAVNASFASASMPISMTAETQGTNENQVYIGMFRPDEQGRPRWMGNLKRYQYEWDATLRAPYLADANRRAAYDSVTGFINIGATSYWTQSSDYWLDIPGYDEESDSPDGPVVEKGAAAQQMRERASERTLLTCNSSCRNGSALQALNIPDSSLARWMLGYDVDNETSRNNSNERRPSIHGDVLHSRPLVLNYNKTRALGSGDDVVVFYGANDGLFRAVRGEDGEEVWAMAFLEQQDRLQTLRDNLAEEENDSFVHSYFMDGSPSAYTEYGWNTAKSERYINKAWLYLPMRRGGDFLYALDVSDLDDPAFKWKIQGGSGQFSTLGQTWSTPKIARVRAYRDGDGNPKPVVFFGGGYDAAAEDYSPAAGGSRPARTRGQGIYMVDADTGTRLWFGTHADMKFSIPGDLTLMNYSRNTEGYAERIYFADTGGNIWRADIGDESTSNWTIRRVANLGGADCTDTSNTDCRKFLYHPSVVSEAEGYVSILIGSGDREHPLDKTVTNNFYLIKDRGQTSTLTESSLQLITDSTDESDLVAAKLRNGWYFQLRAGEKVVGNALTLGGVTYFNTNTPATPSDSSCVSSLGTAREYIVPYQDPLDVADYLLNVFGEEIAGGGFPPPPVPMTLKFGDTYWSGVGGLKPAAPVDAQPGTRQKTFWAKDIDD